MTAKPLIRIVDDDEALTASSAMLLEAMGWDVAVWHSGGAFLDEADLMRPGCLVLDVRMPGLTGLDVQAELERRGSNRPFSFSPRTAAFRLLCMSCATAQSTFSKNPLSR